MNLILALVGTEYQFYHRGKLTKSTKVGQFCYFRSKPRDLSIQMPIFFSDTYQHCCNRKSGNRSSFKLSLQQLIPRFLVHLLFIRMTITLVSAPIHIQSCD